jgi:hypothetical protein
MRSTVAMGHVQSRPGIEVFVNDLGTISVSRRRGEQKAVEPVVLVVHPSELRELVRMLEDAAARVGVQDPDSAEADDLTPHTWPRLRPVE